MSQAGHSSRALRVRDASQDGLATREQQTRPEPVIIPDVRWKIGLHYAPIDGNAAEQYGWYQESQQEEY